LSQTLDTFRFPLRPQGAWRGGREEWRHDCPFPTELVARIIELTTDNGDVVFDPFSGSGVVPATAFAMGRHYLGIELNPKYVKQFNSIVKADIKKEWEALQNKRESMEKMNGSFGSLILRLRALKYARKVTAALNAQIPKLPKRGVKNQFQLKICVCLADIPKGFETGDILEVSLNYLYSGLKRDFDQAVASIEKFLEDFPLSHYRIKPKIKGFGRRADLKRATSSKASRLYFYSRAKPRTYDRFRTVEAWLRSDSDLPKNNNLTPILSNLRVDVSWIADSYGVALTKGKTTTEKK
jgi:DNA methylase